MVPGIAKCVFSCVVVSTALLGRGEALMFLRNATAVGTAVQEASASPPTATGRSDNDGARDVIEADGGVEMIPARVSIRCRYEYLRDYKFYRIFMAPGVLPYKDWCKSVQHAINHNCRVEPGTDRIVYTRCDSDGRDQLWDGGFVVTFESRVDLDANLRCVERGLVESVPGSMVDWKEIKGCYTKGGYHELEV